MKLITIIFLTILFFISSCTSCGQTSSSLVSIDSIPDSTKTSYTLLNDTLFNMKNLTPLDSQRGNPSTIIKHSNIVFKNDSISTNSEFYGVNTFYYTQLNNTLLFVYPPNSNIDGLSYESNDTGYSLYYKSDEKMYYNENPTVIDKVEGTEITNSVFIFSTVNSLSENRTIYEYCRLSFFNDSIAYSIKKDTIPLNIDNIDWSLENSKSTSVSYIYDNSENFIGFKMLELNKDYLYLLSFYDGRWYAEQSIFTSYSTWMYDLI